MAGKLCVSKKSVFTVQSLGHNLCHTWVLLPSQIENTKNTKIKYKNTKNTKNTKIQKIQKNLVLIEKQGEQIEESLHRGA